jgi:hypothetical protein
MFEPFVRVTAGRAQPLEFQFDPAGIGLVALGVMALECCVVPELLSLAAVPPSESRCLRLELRGACCLAACRLRVMSVFLGKPYCLVCGLAIEITERAIHGSAAMQLLVGHVLDLVSRGGERPLDG